MLQAFGLTYTADSRRGPLFEDIGLSVGWGEKVALVGPNGAGKSILIKLLVGALQPDRGRVVSAGTRVGYLAQDFDLKFEGSLREAILAACPGVEEYQFARALHRLGLSNAMIEREFSTLSLGERMRGALAALLASDPDILVLDEPTNHLDVQAREWLEGFLASCPEGVLFACHDRRVIDHVATKVLELDRGSLTEYGGNYAAMTEEKRRRTAHQREQYERQKGEDRRLRVAMEEQLQRAASVLKKPTTRTFDPKASPFFKAKSARMDKRAKAIRSRIEHAREGSVEKPFEPDQIALEFSARPLRSFEAVRARDLTKAYGEKILFQSLSLRLGAGERIAIVGPNGSGKTTLFRILLGQEIADSGEVTWAADARVAVLSQARDALDLSLPACDAIPGDAQFVRTALACLGMRGDMATRPVRVLSVGERTKAELVSMLATEANVLVLDEPTNHLDIASVEALEDALTAFPGAILFTSHDREFVERVATEVIALI